MPSLDQMNPQEEAPVEEEQVPAEGGGDQLSEEEELDLKLVVKTAAKLMGEGGGLEKVGQALKQSKDPAAVLGPFFATLFGKLQESIPPDMEVSPRVYLAQGGVLEQMLDYMEKKLGLPPEFSDNVFGSVIETIKAAAQGEQQKMGPPPPAAPPPPPQGGGLQGVA